MPDRAVLAHRVHNSAAASPDGNDAPLLGPHSEEHHNGAVLEKPENPHSRQLLPTSLTRIGSAGSMKQVRDVLRT